VVAPRQRDDLLSFRQSTEELQHFDRRHRRRPHFSEYSSISGNGEMDISSTATISYSSATTSSSSFTNQHDTKYTAFDAGSRSFDSVYITPNNNVILSWYPSGTARYTGRSCSIST